MKTPTEYDEQKLFVKWLELKNLKFTAIPNSTYTKSIRQKMANKAMGLRKGLPDLLVIVPNGICFVEMKRAKKSLSKTSPEQIEWINELQKIDCVEARVCYGCNEAIDFIKQFV